MCEEQERDLGRFVVLCIWGVDVCREGCNQKGWGE